MKWFPWRNRRDHERGAVAVVVALFLVVFITLLAFVVDLGRVFAYTSQLQNAADAGALAGAQDLPTTVTGSCDLWPLNAACIYANSNDVAISSTSVVSPYKNDECRIWVQTTGYVDFVFGPLVGVNGRDVSTEAVGKLGCTTVYTIFGKEQVKYNGEGSQGDSIYAGQFWQFGGNNPNFTGIYIEPGGEFKWTANYTPPPGVENPDTEPIETQVYYQALIDAGIAETVPTAPATVPECSDLTSSAFTSASDVYCSDNNKLTLNLDPCMVVAPKIAVDGDLTVGTGNAIAAGSSNDWQDLNITLVSNRTVLLPPAAKPTQVLSLSATAGNQQVSLSWTAVTASPAVSDYVVEYRQGTSGNWSVFADGVSTATSATVTGLTNGFLYQFRVSAKNGAQPGDVGPSSDVVSATPTAPPAAPGAPVLSAASGVTSSSAVLTWTAPATGGTVANYVVQYRTSTGPGLWQTFATVSSATLSSTVTGLSSTTGYDFQVLAKNATAETPSNQVSATTLTYVAPPGAPTLSAPTGVTSAQVNLSWVAPFSGGTVSNYVVEYRTSAGLGAWETFSTPPAANTSTIVNGLNQSTAYDFRVSAANAGGSTPSNVESATTLANLLAPGPPTLGSIGSNDVTSTTVNLSWAAPNSGGAVSNYSVQYSDDGGATWTQSSVLTSAYLSVTVSGLLSGTDYSFRVVASNASGSGVPSNVETATTDAGSPCGSQLTGVTTLLFATGDIDITDFNSPNTVVYAPFGSVTMSESGPGKVTRVKMVIAGKEVTFNGGEITAAEDGDIIRTRTKPRLFE